MNKFILEFSKLLHIKKESWSLTFGSFALDFLENYFPHKIFLQATTHTAPTTTPPRINIVLKPKEPISNPEASELTAVPSGEKTESTTPASSEFSFNFSAINPLLAVSVI